MASRFLEGLGQAFTSIGQAGTQLAALDQKKKAEQEDEKDKSFNRQLNLYKLLQGEEDRAQKKQEEATQRERDSFQFDEDKKNAALNDQKRALQQLELKEATEYLQLPADERKKRDIQKAQEKAALESAVGIASIQAWSEALQDGLIPTPAGFQLSDIDPNSGPNFQRIPQDKATDGKGSGGANDPLPVVTALTSAIDAKKQGLRSQVEKILSDRDDTTFGFITKPANDKFRELLGVSYDEMLDMMTGEGKDAKRPESLSVDDIVDNFLPGAWGRINDELTGAGVEGEVKERLARIRGIGDLPPEVQQILGGGGEDVSRGTFRHPMADAFSFANVPQGATPPEQSSLTQLGQGIFDLGGGLRDAEADYGQASQDQSLPWYDRIGNRVAGNITGTAAQVPEAIGGFAQFLGGAAEMTKSDTPFQDAMGAVGGLASGLGRQVLDFPIQASAYINGMAKDVGLSDHLIPNELLYLNALEGSALMRLQGGETLTPDEYIARIQQETADRPSKVSELAVNLAPITPVKSAWKWLTGKGGKPPVTIVGADDVAVARALDEAVPPPISKTDTFKDIQADAIPDGLVVKVKGTRAKTGEVVERDIPAKSAIKRVDKAIDQYKNLLACLRS